MNGQFGHCCFLGDIGDIYRLSPKYINISYLFEVQTDAQATRPLNLVEEEDDYDDDDDDDNDDDDDDDDCWSDWENVVNPFTKVYRYINPLCMYWA